MSKPESPNKQAIEIRGFKWPRRPTAVAKARLLGEDEFGRWLGVAKGDPWWEADGSGSGRFESSFIKLVPSGTFWTACFNLADPVVDVDIVLPVQWIGNVLEEVDLELDILRFVDGSVRLRDQEEFNVVRRTWGISDDIAREAEAECDRMRERIELGAEPFGEVGRGWLLRFLTEAEVPGT